jgi:rhodanese-related sulfurtransferase
VVYCRSGNRSASAKYVLEQLGYTNVNDFGGVYRWKGELVRRQ